MRIVVRSDKSYHLAWDAGPGVLLVEGGQGLKKGMQFDLAVQVSSTWCARRCVLDEDANALSITNLVPKMGRYLVKFSPVQP